MTIIHGWSAAGKGERLRPVTVDLGPLGAEEVEIAIEYCGICHSDVSVIHDEWGVSKYPVIPGHEAVGRIVALGAQTHGLALGQRVGVGFNAESCMHCRDCLTGHHNVCAQAVPTIIGHNGGFADRLRAHWAWTIPLPDGLEMASAGPLLCGGIAMYAPLAAFGVRPPDRVGIVGIGGLGHLGLMFARAWGCEVTAFTSTMAKADEARRFGAHRVVSSRDRDDILKAANSLDIVLVTVATPLDWDAYMKTLRPHGRVHMLGMVMEPMGISAVDLVMNEKNVSGSPTVGPALIREMLEFAGRHGIAPVVEHFPLSKVNAALDHLASGNARYRIVLDVAA